MSGLDRFTMLGKSESETGSNGKAGNTTSNVPQELLHVDMDARVDIRDGQMKGINEKALVFTVFRYGFPDTSLC